MQKAISHRIDGVRLEAAMIDAGVAEFLKFDERFETVREAVTQIYIAMRKSLAKVELEDL